MKYKIIWSKAAGEQFVEIISWYKYNTGIIFVSRDEKAIGAVADRKIRVIP
ncbi:MAG: hypothetical protein LBP80_02170 [Treponema sp.]|jgi:hypothetical protein|nr:hypothetical protein [Treponema sp.]